ncbi:hypothetical protein [Streptomyces sp. NPDC057939]|uniref:hypothetical protein n=1 Tax=Streptomyces sp. NPDC057939 TaxID=3346284 RepID=UPI0036E73D93
MLQAVMAYLVTATCLFLLGSIPMLVKVDDLTDTPNFAAPLFYSTLMACTGSGIVLIINWRVIHDGPIALNPYFDLALRDRSVADELTRGVERHVISTSKAPQEGFGERRDLLRVSRSLSTIPAAARPSARREPA